MKNIPKKNLLAAMISSAVLMTGCGSDAGNSLVDRAINSLPSGQDTPDSGTGNAGGGTPEDNTSTSQNPFAGSSNISGLISLSSLFGADASALNSGSTQTPKRAKISTRSAFAQPRAATATADNAIIKLFSVASNGDLKDTGINCDFTADTDAKGNPKYTCEGVADGQNYVVKYVRILGDNKALEMKVNVEVPKGAAAAPAEAISPQSTVVVDAIVNAVLSATEGKDIDKEVIGDIISSVKKVVEKLVQTGAVQVPSMVVDAPKDAAGNFIADAAKLAKGKNLKFSKNENLESVTGALLSSEDVAKEVDAVKVEIEVREFSRIDTQNIAGKKKLVEKIFRKLLGGDDVPRFIVDFFAARYNAGATEDVGTLFKAVAAGLNFNPDLGIDPGDLGLSADETATALQQLLAKLYSLQDKKASGIELSRKEKAELADIPAIISAVFPAREWKNVDITPVTVFDVPQAVVFTIFMTDEYVPAAFSEKTGRSLDAIMSVGGDNEASKEVSFENPVDFNPMGFDESGENPGLLQLYGFFDKQYLAGLSGVDISHLDISPDRGWIPDNTQQGPGGKEVDMMRAHVCFTDLSLFAKQGGDSGNPESGLSVELSYPTSTGERKSVQLRNERDLFQSKFKENAPQGGDAGDGPRPGGDQGGPAFESCFTLDPWNQARKAAGVQQDQPVQLTAADIISDFVSGSYKVVVRQAGVVTAEREFKKKVIVGMRDAVPVLTSPHGMPQWPAECSGKEYCEKWDELNQKWQEEGGQTTFAMNADSDGDAIDDKAKITITWEKPQVSLPEGVKLAYSLDVFKHGGGDGEDRKFDSIYSTHEKNRRLFGLSFTIPKLLDKLEIGEGSYNVNLCAEFIDTQSGEYLGSGGCTFADFNVGEPLNMESDFNIVGTAPVVDDGRWRVALISESFGRPAEGGKPEDQPRLETIRSSLIDAKGNYTLTPTIGDFLNLPPNTNFSVVLFRDDNNDGLVTGKSDSKEITFWAGWDSHVRFETWGGTLRAVSENRSKEGDAVKFDRKEIVVTGGEQVEGPDFSEFANEMKSENGFNPSPEQPKDGAGDTGSSASTTGEDAPKGDGSAASDPANGGSDGGEPGAQGGASTGGSFTPDSAAGSDGAAGTGQAAPASQATAG